MPLPESLPRKYDHDDVSRVNPKRMPSAPSRNKNPNLTEEELYSCII